LALERLPCSNRADTTVTLAAATASKCSNHLEWVAACRVDVRTNLEHFVIVT
jgi:hypothetical protein